MYKEDYKEDKVSGILQGSAEIAFRFKMLSHLEDWQAVVATLAAVGFDPRLFFKPLHSVKEALGL